MIKKYNYNWKNNKYYLTIKKNIIIYIINFLYRLYWYDMYSNYFNANLPNNLRIKKKSLYFK